MCLAWLSRYCKKKKDVTDFEEVIRYDREAAVNGVVGCAFAANCVSGHIYISRPQGLAELFPRLQKLVEVSQG